MKREIIKTCVCGDNGFIDKTQNKLSMRCLKKQIKSVPTYCGGFLCSAPIPTVNGTRAASLHTLCELNIKSGSRCTGVHYLLMPAEETQMLLCTSTTYSTVYTWHLEVLFYKKYSHFMKIKSILFWWLLHIHWCHADYVFFPILFYFL